MIPSKFDEHMHVKKHCFYPEHGWKQCFFAPITNLIVSYFLVINKRHH